MRCSLGSVVRFGALLVFVYLSIAILITREITRVRPEKVATFESSPTICTNSAGAATQNSGWHANKQASIGTQSGIPVTAMHAPIEAHDTSSVTDNFHRTFTTTSSLTESKASATSVESSLFRDMMLATGHGFSRNMLNYTYENLLMAGQMTEEKRFCYAQLVDTYGRPNLTDCNSMVGVWHCKTSRFSDRMSYCLAYNVSLNDGHVSKLSSSLDQCPARINGTNHSGVERKFCLSALETVALSTCKDFVDLAYFYSVNSVHIYFKVLCYYSIFETLLRNGHSIKSVRFYRSVELTNWPNMFAEFEEKMFGKVINFVNASNVCFREVHLVPNGYSTNPFRCKMAADNMGLRCKKCEGRHWPIHAVHLFKRFILDHCGLQGSPSRSETLQIAFVLRKPYERFLGDEKKEFSRILLNSNQVLDALRHLYQVNVSAVALEKLAFCAQVRLAWEADIVVAVHGSALVHLWWTNADAEVIEIEPLKQRGNPTFRMLSTLTSTRYSAYTIKEIKETHVALGQDFIKFVESRIDNLRKVRRAGDTYNGIPAQMRGTLPLQKDIIYDKG